MVTTDGVASLPRTRAEILRRIKMEGELTVDQLAAAIGISLQATRQQLTALERDGLVTHRERRDGQGRPRYIFTLTVNGDGLFPRRYADLTTELLGYVEADDPELLKRIFERRAERRIAEAQDRTAGLSFAERVRTVAQILDEDGYLADFTARDDGTFLITEHNCAVLTVAFRYGHACSSELDFLQAALPEADVVRIAHRIAGAHVCSYEIRPGPGEE